ncbi:hypothetical protein A1O1_00027 [Capronia coronata CBS 617.96]|uniref:Uncharacterized protein n=1 Tax=Capronia coronata CBS 617.96 TaxID=1182541 RepID=W9ZK92_9EURO|nr:uncharacterized protein A1O1_00027 [Capronia coronata CBS 617.96]EXJ94909.1 hypothetical protein A1O1_00027 [Capronia coronata CBS 617.96]
MACNERGSSGPFLDSAYITWPAPKCRYSPSKAISHDEVEPFPDFPNPSNNLIIARTLLLDTLHSRSNSHTRGGLSGTLFRSLYSRIAPFSGHIKENEDLTRCRASLEQIFEAGQALRVQRMQGNSAKLVSLRGTYPDMYASNKDPEPKLVLRMKLKTKAKRGIAKAFAIERNGGFELLNDQEHGIKRQRDRGRSSQRESRRALAALYAKYDPDKAIKSLMMLRQTYPTHYKPQSVTGVDRKGKSTTNGRISKDLPKSSSTALMPSEVQPITRPVSSDDKEGPSTRGASHKALRNAVSMTSLTTVKQSTTSLVRRMATKVGVRPAAMDISMSAQVNVVEKGTLHPAEQTVGEQVADIDSFPVAVKLRTETAAAPSTAPTPANPRKDTLKRQGRCFLIEREPVHAAEEETAGEDVYVSASNSHKQCTPSHSTPVTKRGRARSDTATGPSSMNISDADTASVEAMAVEPVSAEMVRLSRPSFPPRIICIPARKNPVKQSKAEISIPTAGPDAKETSAAEKDDDWVVVTREADQQAETEIQTRQYHRHAFRGYVTRPRPHLMGRPQSMVAMSRSYFAQAEGTSVDSVARASNAGHGADRNGDRGSHILSDVMHKLERDVFGYHPRYM